MEYPFPFNELLLTPACLRYIGFDNWWGDSGDGFDIAYGNQGDGKSIFPGYRLKATSEEAEPYSYSVPYYETERIISSDYRTLYFLHELYENAKKLMPEDQFNAFMAILKKKSVWSYIDSYINYKIKQP